MWKVKGNYTSIIIIFTKLVELCNLRNKCECYNNFLKFNILPFSWTLISSIKQSLLETPNFTNLLSVTSYCSRWEAVCSQTNIFWLIKKFQNIVHILHPCLSNDPYFSFFETKEGCWADDDCVTKALLQAPEHNFTLFHVMKWRCQKFQK